MEKEYYLKWKGEFAADAGAPSSLEENTKRFLGIDNESGQKYISIDRQERIEDLKKKTAQSFMRSDAQYNPDKCTVGVFYEENLTDGLKKEDMIDIDRKSRASNSIFSPNTYQTGEFKKDILKTTTQAEHHSGQFIAEPANKQFNLRRTVISEYSNAKHNQTVFINPRFMSC